MQDAPLNLAHILEHASEFHGTSEIVTRQVDDGSIHRYTYRDAYRRTQQLANALAAVGVQRGDRIATMGWNTYRHLESWYAIAGQGAICHTINPRLFEQQIEFIIRHAEDKLLLLDAPFIPLMEKLQDRLPSIEQFIVMGEPDQVVDSSLRRVIDFESFIEGHEPDFHWPELPEDTPSSLCYTSGTTGNPKGVTYTHRSNFLHAWAVNGKDAIGVSRHDILLLIVPMFHANSWGLAYSAPMVGAKLVLPGCQLDGKSVYELLDQEKVSLSAGVPTVWNMLLKFLEETDHELPWLDEILVGGSAVPRSMIEAFDQRFQVCTTHGWGMTELSPLGTMCRLKPEMKCLSYAEQVDIRVKQGSPLFGVAMKIVDDAGSDLPHDGKTCGRLLVKGPWIVKRYYRESEDAVDQDGWFDTGDIATIDSQGYMQITDRAKDLIKSGGEWISSVDLENAALGHPEVAMAAVIGVHHPKWEERPLLIIEPRADCQPKEESILDYLRSRVAKWWLPDKVILIDKIPLTATGKISKLTLRQEFADFQL